VGGILVENRLGWPDLPWRIVKDGEPDQKLSVSLAFAKLTLQVSYYSWM
jgi:hypothetical protein